MGIPVITLTIMVVSVLLLFGILGVTNIYYRNTCKIEAIKAGYHKEAIKEMC